jgi:hypothetical protein
MSNIMLEEHLKRLKNSRSGSLSAVTAKKNEINTLLAEDADVKGLFHYLLAISILLDDLTMKILSFPSPKF